MHRLHAEGMSPVKHDKNAYHGGHTASFQDSGFIFDQGRHISSTKDARILRSVCRQRGPDVRDHAGQIEQLLAWLRPSTRCSRTHGLPEDVIVKVISDFVEERQAPERAVKTYADWLLTSFGKTFSELFPMTRPEIPHDDGR